VETVVIDHDQDKDGILDLKTWYKELGLTSTPNPATKTLIMPVDTPPPKEGVCTDVIWQAFQAAGYDRKTMLDEDIKNTLSYLAVAGQPIPISTFAACKIFHAFFKRQATDSLGSKTRRPENLKEWQGGDIVIFGPSGVDTSLLSLTRRPRRSPPAPYITRCPYCTEADTLLRLVVPYYPAHYRYPK